MNRDLVQDKSNADDAPVVKNIRPAEQLAQREGSSSPLSRATPKIPPSPPQSQKTEEKVAGQDTQEATLVPPAPAAPPPSLPSPESKGLQGADNTTLSEFSRAKSRGAQLYGSTSFEATGSGMGVYMKNLKEKIWTAWFPYLMAHYPKDFKAADTLLHLKLNAKGEVLDVQLLDSKGSALFDAFCMQAVRRAGPFGALPEEILGLLGKDEIDIKFAFHYW